MGGITKRAIAQIADPEGTPQRRKAGSSYPDGKVEGLAVVAYPNGRRVWSLYFRTTEGRRRRMNLGDALLVHPTKARARAREILGKVAAGGDPADDRDLRRKAQTIDELCTEYLKVRESTRKPRTVKMDRHQIERWIRPRWGKRFVSSIGPKDCEDLHLALKSTPIRANRIRSMVHHMFNTATRWGWRSGPNPASHVERYPEHGTHRPLSEVEMQRLGEVLTSWPREKRLGAHGTRAPTEDERTWCRRIVDVITLIALTGCRKAEILELTWQEVDFDEAVLRLADSKTGARLVFLSQAAVAVLRRQKPGGSTALVFPGRKRGRPIGSLQESWSEIRKQAQLEDVRIHDLRHNVGARASERGLSQAQIARLLGHRQTRTTDRYSTPHDHPSARAAEMVSGSISDDLGISSDETDLELDK